jgi:hypothetical protein
MLPRPLRRALLCLATASLVGACGAPAPAASSADAHDDAPGFCQRMRAKWTEQGLEPEAIEAKAKECERLEAKQAEQRKAEAEAKKRKLAKQQAKDDADAEAADRADSAKKAAAESRETRIRDWQTASAAKCAAAFAVIGCDDAPLGTNQAGVDVCHDGCIAAVAKAVDARFADALGACVDKYAAASGSGAFRCAVTLPEGADLQGDALSARVATCSRDCATRGAEAVAVARKAKLEQDKAEADRKKAEADAKKAAEARAKERAKAATQAPDLVTSFRKCMEEVDGSPEAKDLRGRDCGQYAAHMTKAREQCRTKYKCAWVEDYSDVACEYKTLACYDAGK